MEQKQVFINTEFETKTAEEDRTIEFIVSKEIVDRGGDVVKIKGIDLKNFKKNPVIMLSHNHSDLPIGKAISMRKTGDELRMKVEFPTPEVYSLGDTVYKLVKGGFLNATSVGIIPDYKSMEFPEGKGGASRIINKCELFEVSVVGIPMNQSALRVKMTKAIDDGVIDELEYKELETAYIKSEMKEDQSDERDTSLENEVIELKAKVAELELQLKEQEMDAELEDDIYAQLYDEFTTDKKIDKDSIEELYNEFMDKDDKGCNDILDEYL